MMIMGAASASLIGTEEKEEDEREGECCWQVDQHAKEHRVWMAAVAVAVAEAKVISHYVHHQGEDYYHY